MLVLVLQTPSTAAEDNWRIALKADNGAGSYSAASAMFGVHPQSSDGVDTEGSVQDQEDVHYYTDITQAMRLVVGIIPDSEITWIRDIMSPASPATYPGLTKRWILRVAAAPLANWDPIRLRFFTLSLPGSTSHLPPSSVAGRAVSYRLVMTDNKGMSGAPPNGTVWQVPAPTQHVSSVAYYTVPALFPVIKLSSYTHTAMITEGYQLEFQQIAVPEPVSLLTLAGGLTSLVGLGFRRRNTSHC
jgi:hypothetical protein